MTPDVWWDGQSTFATAEEAEKIVALDRIVHEFETIVIQCKDCKRYANPIIGSECHLEALCCPCSTLRYVALNYGRKRGRVTIDHIPLHLAPSPDLIAAAEANQNMPLEYDAEDDVYFQKHD